MCRYQSCNGSSTLLSPCITTRGCSKSSTYPIPVQTIPEKMTRMPCRYRSPLTTRFSEQRKGPGKNLSIRFSSRESVVFYCFRKQTKTIFMTRYLMATRLVKQPRRFSFGDLQCSMLKLAYRLVSSLGKNLQS